MSTVPAVKLRPSRVPRAAASIVGSGAVGRPVSGLNVIVTGGLNSATVWVTPFTSGAVAVTDQVLGIGLAVTLTPVAVAVAACDRTIVVAFVTDWIVVPAGMPAPEIGLPTSAAPKFAVADVRVVLPDVVAPSLKLSRAAFENVNVTGM